MAGAPLNKVLVSILCLTSLTAIACDRKVGSQPVDNRDFRMDDYRLILYFDLRNDKQPTAGLTINAQPSQEVEQHSVVLPFETEKVETNEDLYTTHGSYKDFTIINYILTPTNSGTKLVGIDPVFDNPPEDQFASTTELKGSLYFIAKGLERRFIYKYPHSLHITPPTPKNVYLDSPDAIAIAIPDSAIGKEIRRGQTEIPAHLFEKRSVRFYPANSEVSALELRYELPPTSGQKIVLEYGVKLIAVILPPLLGLLLLGSGEIMAPRTRRIAIVVGITIEIAILIVVWRVAIGSKSEGQLKIILDLTLVLVGAAFTGIVIWVKRKGKTA